MTDPMILDDKRVLSILSNLKFISKIKEGDIVNIETKTLSERSFITSLKRTISRMESRKTAFEFFRTTVNDAVNIAQLYSHGSNSVQQETFKNIIIELRNCQQGLENHILTYGDDNMHKSKIEALMTTLNTKLSSLEENIQPRPNLRG